MSNLRAFLDTIAACEGTDGPAGYRTLYGGGQFDLDTTGGDHPRRSVTAGGYTSTAAGRYQILAGTWDDFTRATYPRKFDAAGQDACAQWLIDRRGALQDAQDGALASALQKCGKEWASLPGSPYGQPTRSYAYCEQHYLAAGGVLNSGTTVPDLATTVAVPATPPKGPTMGAALALLPLLAQFIPQIMTLIKPGSASTAKDAAVAQTILNTVVQAAGVVSNGPANAQSVGAAVDAMHADPSLVAKVQEAVVTHPDVIGLLEIGGGAQAARDQDTVATQSAKPFWFSPAFWVTLIVVMPPVDFTVYTVVSRMANPSEQLVTQVVTGLLGLVAVAAAFYYGTSWGSQKKDDALASK